MMSSEDIKASLIVSAMAMAGLAALLAGASGWVAFCTTFAVGCGVLSLHVPDDGI